MHLTKKGIKVKNSSKNSGKKPAPVWEYTKTSESKDHIRLKDKYDLFIGGKRVKTAKYFNTINPANEEVIAKTAYASQSDVNKAVLAAEKAYDKVWSKIHPKEKAKYIFRIARIMQEKARELAVIESMDGGKPIKESKSLDIPLAISHFFYYAGWADKLNFTKSFIGKEPEAIGVVGQIIPWNFPLLMAAWKIAPALACRRDNSTNTLQAGGNNRRGRIARRCCKHNQR